MMQWRRLSLALLVNLPVFAASVVAETQRTHILIVGSSTAFPIVSTVAEHFGRSRGVQTPVVESMGTGGGFKFFCSGAGPETPDISMASRRLSESEMALCQANDIHDVVEIKIGYDGIAFSNSKESVRFNFTLNDLYLALAREIPDPSGSRQMIANPYTRWKQINDDLPDQPIRLLGPPLSSGTRDILIEHLMEGACGNYPVLRDMLLSNADEYQQRCSTFREDGHYVDAGENDARIVRTLVTDPDAIGILGYNFLDRNDHSLQAATIDKVSPDYEMIEAGEYPLSRPLYLYVKREHTRIHPALSDFLIEFTSAASWGEDGYLVEKGLIPLSEEESLAGRKKAMLGRDTCLGGVCRSD